ncbi:MAG TPA: IS1 family transposase [Pyrinomonadaceae bacterium]|jgi:IS1 family transposase|nr:IS1 family transposase [Pyrinomonadaceae bacterium]
MNKLTNDRRSQVVAALVEGNSIRATSRMTSVAKNTIIKLLEDLGTACANYQDEAFRNLSCVRLECDEIWSFCFAKKKNVSPEHQGIFGYGDVWTWVAIDPDTKLVPCWHVGRRDANAANEFITDLAGRLKNRVMLTTDGFKPYLEAVEGAFGADIDYAMLVKLYGQSQEEVRYSPSKFVGSRVDVITGDPFPPMISTSMVERQNLTMRMSMRRFTRLTNGFSKKVENHMHAIALHYMYYNFARIHRTLRCSPAMEAGVSKTLWSIGDIVALADNPKYARRDED